MPMQAVSVSVLKNNPAEALRQAKTGPVVVLNRDHPDALLIDERAGRAVATELGLRVAGTAEPYGQDRHLGSLP